MSEDWVSEKLSLHDMIPYLESPEDWWLFVAQSIKEDECGKSQTSFVRDPTIAIPHLEDISIQIQAFLSSNLLKLKLKLKLKLR
jgi:hypothetical protein